MPCHAPCHARISCGSSAAARLRRGLRTRLQVQALHDAPTHDATNGASAHDASRGCIGVAPPSADALTAGKPPLHDVIIVGSGPAGYTAAIYAGRASLRPLCFEGVQKGGVPGGQLMTTTEVENFPGFPEGVTGPDLMDRMRKQAERWGCELATEDVESVDLSVRPFVVRTSERTVRTHALIVATGATAKRLGLPSEETFWSRGISACAICDGASPLFKGQEVAVVGGGDSAAEEAVYLTKYARRVHLLVRGSRLRASAAMADRVKANPNVTIHYHSPPLDVYGDVKGRMAGVLLGSEGGGEGRKLPVRGLFYAVGHKPNSELLAGQVELDEAGYVVLKHGASTSVEGVFAAGDLHDTEWRQAVTAAGSGCAAAIAAERWLASTEGSREEATHHVMAAAKAAAAAAAVAAEATDASAAAPPSAAAAAAAAAAVASAARAAAPASASEAVETATAAARAKAAFDVNASFHKGQYALRRLYHESTRPLLVIYTSPTCGPCRRLKPMLTGLVGEDAYAGAVQFIEIDIEADAAIAEAAGIAGTPTVQVFLNRERVGVLKGVKNKSEYRQVLDAALGRAPAAAAV